MIWLAAVLFIFVHGPRGQEIRVNVEKISSVQEPDKHSRPHFAPHTHCMLIMNNGKFISTQESCSEVLKMISELK